MLILSRKLNESIVINGNIIVKVLRIERDTVKLGIQAPAELSVHRQEIHEVIMRNRQASGNAGTESIPKSSRAQVTPPAERPPGGGTPTPPGTTPPAQTPPTPPEGSSGSGSGSTPPPTP